MNPDFWKLFAGLGLFLYGMFHLEDTMKQIQGRPFKIFLQKNTQNKVKAIFSGLIVTAILQSSSIVNLMLLSFVGAGVLSMRNAMAVVLGAKWPSHLSCSPSRQSPSTIFHLSRNSLTLSGTAHASRCGAERPALNSLNAIATVVSSYSCPSR